MAKREMGSPVLRLCSTISRTKTFLYPVSTFNSQKLYSIQRRKLVCSAPSDSNPVCSERELSLSLKIETHIIPHPNKVEKGGEDAFCISNYKGGVIAVADGVSGWAEKDVDPALFSRELMAHAFNLIEDEEVQYDPRTLIKKAHAATSSVGSATAIVAMLETNGLLKIANVGDCGLRIVRKGQVVFSSSPQEHYFDCPYQLSSEAVGQTYLDATVTTVELLEGDTVVMGSDGLFDNVFDREIVSVVGSYNNIDDTGIG